MGLWYLAHSSLDTDDRDNSLLVEHTFVRLLYTLAHHPDFSTDVDDLQMFTAYVFWISSESN
jgi:hypothetical protein